MFTYTNTTPSSCWTCPISKPRRGKLAKSSTTPLTSPEHDGYHTELQLERTHTHCNFRFSILSVGYQGLNRQLSPPLSHLSHSHPVLSKLVEVFKLWFGSYLFSPPVSVSVWQDICLMVQLHNMFKLEQCGPITTKRCDGNKIRQTYTTQTHAHTKWHSHSCSDDYATKCSKILWCKVPFLFHQLTFTLKNLSLMQQNKHHCCYVTLRQLDCKIDLSFVTVLVTCNLSLLRAP